MLHLKWPWPRMTSDDITWPRVTLWYSHVTYIGSPKPKNKHFKLNWIRNYKALGSLLSHLSDLKRPLMTSDDLGWLELTSNYLKRSKIEKNQNFSKIFFLNWKNENFQIVNFFSTSFYNKWFSLLHAEMSIWSNYQKSSFRSFALLCSMKIHPFFHKKSIFDQNLWFFKNCFWLKMISAQNNIG